MRYEIESLAKGGEGIARVEGKTYFIAKTLPGECGEFKVTEEKKNFGRGVVVKCDKVSHFRVKDACPVRACNGCGFRHVAPASSLEFKARAVHENVMRQAGLNASDFNPIFWPVSEFDGTRRRIRIHVMRSGSGLFAQGSHKIVDITKCLMLPEALRRVVVDIKEHFVWKCDPTLDVQIDLDDEDRAFAEVRVNNEVEEYNTKTPKDNKRGSKNSNKRPFMGRYEHEQVENYLSGAVERGVLCGGAYQNRVWGQASLRDVVTVDGKSVITWRRIGRFGQATREANEILHKIVAKNLELYKPKTVLDLFCGAGNFTFRAAMTAKTVVGAEFFGDRDTFAHGLEDTNAAAKLGAVSLRLVDLDKGLPELDVKPELIITDPARVGMTEKLCSEIVNSGANTIIYISCEASCLGRDLKWLMKAYTPTEFHYVDMFPRTADVETVVILRRRQFDSHVDVDFKMSDLRR